MRMYLLTCRVRECINVLLCQAFGKKQGRRLAIAVRYSGSWQVLRTGLSNDIGSGVADPRAVRFATPTIPIHTHVHAMPHRVANVQALSACACVNNTRMRTCCYCLFWHVIAAHRRPTAKHTPLATNGISHALVHQSA